MVFAPDGGSIDIKVYSNYDWSLSTSCTWCTPSITSGQASDDGQIVTLTAEVSYDDREGTIVFSCGNAKKLLVVSQSLKEVIIADENNTFNIPANGGTAVLSYQTNIECKIVIPSDAQSWLTLVPDNKSRALVSESATIQVAENTTYSARSAVVKVVAVDNESLIAEYTINQEQNDAVIADENNTFTVPSIGGTVKIYYQTNVECKVIIPEEAQSWISVATATRALENKYATLNIAENTTYSARSAVVKVVAKGNESLVAEYTIHQVQNDEVIANNNTFEIYGMRQTISIPYQTNVECKVTIPAEAQSWISVATATRALENKSATLTIADNETGEERSAVVKVVAVDNDKLFAEYTITQAPRYHIEYTSADGHTTVNPFDSGAFGAAIIRNEYIDGKGYIDFDAPVTSIGDYAFYNYCSSLTSITIPDGVTSIGDYTFRGCSSLESITIPEGVTSIGIWAFYDCSSLAAVDITDISAWCNIVFQSSYSNPLYYAKKLYLNGELITDLTIPEGVTSIGTDAFYYCSSLTSITIPDSVTSIGSSAFYKCSSLTSINIPDSVTFIGDSAFAGCSSLKSITIPDGVTSIGLSAFYGCSSLASINIPNSVTSIGSSAFCGCTGKLVINSNSLIAKDHTTSSYPSKDGWLAGSEFTSLVIGNGVTSIGNYAFSGCSSLTSITIPEGVTSIGWYAFSGCSSLTSITIPDSVTSIGSYAFSYCSSLGSVTIGNGVTSIRYRAFRGCSSLVSITIPDSVTSIGDDAFEDCSSLTSVYCKPTTPPSGDFYMFYNNASGRKIYVPIKSVEAYKSAEGWSHYASYIVGYDF